MREEVRNICKDFSKNGYSDQYVKKIIYMVARGNHPDNNTREMRNSAVIPYTQGILEKIRTILRLSLIHI